MEKTLCLSFIVFLTYLTGCCNVVYSSHKIHCVKDAYPPSNKTRITEYVFDLDLPPEQRWDKIMQVHAKGVRDLLVVFKDFVGTKILSFVDKYIPYLLNGLPKEYVQEIHGISNATNLKLGEVAMFNLFYEFFTACTSIIARDRSDKLFHVRNMDFGLLLGWNDTSHSWKVSDALRPLTVALDFRQSGKPVYKGVTFAGFIGILTAVKKNKFTFSINERFALKGGFIGILEWILGKRDQQWLSIFTRELMLKQQNYDSAKHVLSITKLLAPAYFIVGGTQKNEGCVITRSRTDVLNVRCLNDSQSFVLQTNYDYWKPAPFYDDRRDPALKCTKELKEISLPQLYNVLSTRPVLNKLTVYAALMTVDQGHLEVWRRKCPDPCPPW